MRTPFAGAFFAHRAPRPAETRALPRPPRSSPPVKVVIPHGRPETTFDIKYYTRERRRAHEPALQLAPRKLYSIDPRSAAALEGPPAAPGARAALQGRARIVPLLDDTNNGYT